MINFSFIIPHKNTPQLLEKCINSIPKRDDVQIIVVDDNSDPEIVDFSHYPGSEIPKVTLVITKEGKGAGYARNIGLRYAQGKWVIFADADDYFTNEIEAAMDDYKGQMFDVVFFKNKSVKIPSLSESYRGVELNRRVDLAIKTNDYTQAILYSSPCQKFFNRLFLEKNGILFNEVRWGNDVVFMGKVAANAKTYSAADRVIYCITESDNSIIKDPSIESRIVRFYQECENVIILKRTEYRSDPSIFYWHFRTWFDIWKLNKVKAITLIPKAVASSGFKFIREVLRAKFN